jgi:hypothetical protein
MHAIPLWPSRVQQLVQLRPRADQVQAEQDLVEEEREEARREGEELDGEVEARGEAVVVAEGEEGAGEGVE